MAEVETLYNLYFQDVYRYACRLCRNEQLAQDLTADTFLRAMNSLKQFHGECQVRVWLCQITKNLYFTHLRKNRRLGEFDGSETEDSGADVEQALIETETAGRIHRLLHALPEPYREVFTLRVLGELKFRSIGELFGKSENWACVTYHRAKEKLEQGMEDENGTD